MDVEDADLAKHAAITKLKDLAKDAAPVRWSLVFFAVRANDTISLRYRSPCDLAMMIAVHAEKGKRWWEVDPSTFYSSITGSIAKSFASGGRD